MEAAAYLTKTYDPRLVSLSIVVAMAAAYAALDLADRMYAARHRQVWVWLAAGAIVMGSGIWAMHFIGMLALHLPITMNYAIAPTIVSWLMAVLGAACALRLSCRLSLDRRTWLFGSVSMAVAIASMHYTGMYAMQISPGIVYDPFWVGLSGLVAIGGSAAALGWSFRLRGGQQRLQSTKKLGASGLMGLAIAGMHYVAMAAAAFPAASVGYAAGGVNTEWLALLISSLSLVLLAATLLAAALDRRLEHQTASLVHSLREANAQLRYSNNYDGLTDLANRKLFDEKLDLAIDGAGRGAAGFALFYIDLDGFKQLNDNLGHRAGDEVLKHAARGMREATRGHDTVARLGGDEFVILAADVADADNARQMAERVLAAVRQCTQTAPGLSASIGWALYPEHGRRAEELVAAADRAMYHAKNNGKNAAVGYRAEMAEEAEAEFVLQRELASALEQGQITVYYQPKFCAATRTLSGAEALARWHHPRHGMIAPARFIPVAERSGQIDALEAYVLDAVCAQVRHWLDFGYEVPRISVNLSAARISDRGLPKRVQACLNRHHLASRYLMFEITETVAIQGMLEAVYALKQFARMGVEVALDDFGTGHSSLSYLEQLPIHQLKIDRSFIRALSDSNAQPSAIVRSIVALAHSLGLAVVAEGVETESQLAYLVELKCDEVQGFLFSQAVPAEPFTAYLDTTSSRGQAPEIASERVREFG
ncbi:EAL domain-containing protein [Salinisphaera sp. SPP-AMP-43]|uniref:putative bifunctional diguanylate cyclase/phosphodiesterase n=1 Tax=Salinisphaera sp. SPP-AMP-43 TaxID=3121288 RepID=UPI003C6E6974